MDNELEIPLTWLVADDNSYNEVSIRLEDPNARDYQGFTLLHSAARSIDNNNRIVQLLLDEGADVNSTTPHGYTPLHFAVLVQKRNVIVTLIERGASVNAKDCLGRTALHFAIGKRSNIPIPVLTTDVDIWIVEYLSRHPDILMNPVDYTGETPLMWAVIGWKREAIKVLLKYGANPDIPGGGNRTPLHEVLSDVIVDHDIVYSLLMSGAGIYCADHSGETPVDIFVRRFSSDWAFLLSSYCIMLIVLQYQIKESFKTKLLQNPRLSDFLDECIQEVSLMKRLVIYDKVTLHDFALTCFQEEGVDDPVRKICIPIVEILLCGFFNRYFELVLNRLSKSNLRNVVERTAGGMYYPEFPGFLPRGASKYTIYVAIRGLYEESTILKRHLRRFKKFINMMMES